MKDVQEEDSNAGLNDRYQKKKSQSAHAYPFGEIVTEVTTVPGG